MERSEIGADLIERVEQLKKLRRQLLLGRFVVRCLNIQLFATIIHLGISLMNYLANPLPLPLIWLQMIMAFSLAMAQPPLYLMSRSAWPDSSLSKQIIFSTSQSILWSVLFVRSLNTILDYPGLS